MKIFLAIIWIIILLIGIAIFFTKDAIVLEWAQKDFIWKWETDGIELEITSDSIVYYKRNQWNTNVSISWGKITEMTEVYFNVGMLFINSKFEINKMPYKEWGQWRIIIDWNELIKPLDKAELVIPSQEDINKLSINFFDNVNKWLTQNNHQFFYDNISKLWQSSMSVDNISTLGDFETEGFKNFFTNFSNEKIIITKNPIINSDNWLIIEWYYLMNPQLNFEIKYTYEYPEWKLVGFSFQ